MKRLTWWMRIVGGFYLFLSFAAGVLKMPIKVLAPEGTLDAAASGDGVANFLMDTWVILALAVCSIGISLLLNSRNPGESKALIRTVITFELLWGIGSDLYQLWRGHPISVIAIWIVIHVLIITTGILFLRKANESSHAH